MKGAEVIKKDVKILTFPLLRQCYHYDCGASAMESVLSYYGIDICEGDMIKIAKTTKRGTPIKSFEIVAKKFNLKFKSSENMDIEILKKNINNKYPTIIALQAWVGREIKGKWAAKKIKEWGRVWNQGHYAAAIGYDSKRIYFEDPSATIRTYLTFDELKKRWHDRDGKGHKLFNWGIVFYGKKPNYNFNKIDHMD